MLFQEFLPLDEHGRPKDIPGMAEAGVVEALAKLLKSNCATKAKVWAIYALLNMSSSNPDNKEKMREADGISPLIELAMAEDFDLSDLARQLLDNLASNNAANRDFIMRAGYSGRY